MTHIIPTTGRAAQYVIADQTPSEPQGDENDLL